MNGDATAQLLLTPSDKCQRYNVTT